MNRNISLITILKITLSICISFLILSCRSGEDAPEISPPLSKSYDLNINFTDPKQNLGIVNIQPNQLNCKTTCSQTFSAETVVELKAIAQAGAIFVSWGGACSGNSTCIVTMHALQNVTVTFAKAPSSFDLYLQITQGGSVNLTNIQEKCFTDCLLSFPDQEQLTLTATANDGYIFEGWEGDCEGASDCNITMTSNKKATAKFKPTSHACQAQATLPKNHFDNEYAYTNPLHDESSQEVLLTDFTVKETSGNGANNHPVSMVFPVEQGKYFHAGDFHIKNDKGEIVPAQFNVINRWWAKDRSLRHIQAHFNVDITPYITGQPNTGVTCI